MFCCPTPTAKSDIEVGATKPESVQTKIERITASADVGVVIIGSVGDILKVHAHKPFRIQSVANFYAGEKIA